VHRPIDRRKRLKRLGIGGFLQAIKANPTGHTYTNVQIQNTLRSKILPLSGISAGTKLLGDRVMKTKLALTTLAFCALFASAAVMAQKDSDTDRSHPGHFVKDSAITTKIKAKLAADHITSMGRIHVDTDKDGVVWLSGTARTQAAIDQAVSIAQNTEHVVSVHNGLKIRADD
jgi:hyperosmotically inducible periplasmic protein